MLGPCNQRRCCLLQQGSAQMMHCSVFYQVPPWPVQILDMSWQASRSACLAGCSLIRSRVMCTAAARHTSGRQQATTRRISSINSTTPTADASGVTPEASGKHSSSSSSSNDGGGGGSSTSTGSSMYAAQHQLGSRLLTQPSRSPQQVGSLMLQQPPLPASFAMSVWQQQQEFRQQPRPDHQQQHPSSSLASGTLSMPAQVIAAGALLQRECSLETDAAPRAQHSSSSSSSRRFQNPDGDATQDAGQVLYKLAELLAEKGIDLPRLEFGQQRTVCPQCQGGSSREDCFSVLLEDQGSAVWICHRSTCGYKGNVVVRHRTPGASRRSSWGSSGTISPQQPAVLPDVRQLVPLSPAMITWFHQRGISSETLSRNRVQAEWRHHRAVGQVVEHVAFPFYKSGQLVNIKYRALPKHFSQVTGAEQVFYGLDDVQGADVVYIVEGEMDKLAIEEATGITAVLSVPSGASAVPQAKIVPAPGGSSSSRSGPASSRVSRKYAFVDKAQPLLANCSRLVIAVDGDEPGWQTAHELASRLGPQRCSYLAWPRAAVGGADALNCVKAVAAEQGVAFDVQAAAVCKDANDVLMNCGKQVLQLYLAHAPLWKF